jgi:hypothetical protein
MEESDYLHTLAVLSVGKKPSTDSIGAWMGPRASLDVLEKIKLSYLCWDSKPRPSSP